MFANLLAERLRGVASLTAEQSTALERHYELLERWNKVLNLTSIRSLAQAVERHYCESVFLATKLPPGRLSIADIGSGAGFPGFPIAIMRPESSVALIESHQRKAVFLREASRGLPNIRVVAARAEDVLERFDWVVSRAVEVGGIAGTLKRLAPRFALLASEEEPAVDVDWVEAVRVPWGNRRMLWIGVSRETSGC